MQQYLKDGIANCNVISLTGYRALVLFASLLESPKSITEINEIFLADPNIKEEFSEDTLRVYINSLREIGCDISRANRINQYRYILNSHPFKTHVDEETIAAIKKVYNAIYKNISLENLIKIDNLFKKITNNLSSKELSEQFLGISKLKHLSIEMLQELQLHCKKQDKINFLYKSPNTGEKTIEIKANKLEFRNDKLYLFGFSDLNNYVLYRVEHIKKILSLNIHKDKNPNEIFTAKIELKEKNYIQTADETILSKLNDETYIVELGFRNKFLMIQKIMSFGKNCKIIEPEWIKDEVTKRFKKMKETYEK